MRLELQEAQGLVAQVVRGPTEVKSKARSAAPLEAPCRATWEIRAPTAIMQAVPGPLERVLAAALALEVMPVGLRLLCNLAPFSLRQAAAEVVAAALVAASLLVAQALLVHRLLLMVAQADSSAPTDRVQVEVEAVEEVIMQQVVQVVRQALAQVAWVAPLREVAVQVVL